MRGYTTKGFISRKTRLQVKGLWRSNDKVNKKILFFQIWNLTHSFLKSDKVSLIFLFFSTLNIIFLPNSTEFHTFRLLSPKYLWFKKFSFFNFRKLSTRFDCDLLNPYLPCTPFLKLYFTHRSTKNHIQTVKYNRIYTNINNFLFLFLLSPRSFSD